MQRVVFGMKKTILQCLMILLASMLLSCSNSGGGSTQADSDITPTNTAPIAYNLNISTNENTPKKANLKADDSDNDTLTYEIVSSPGHGKVNINANDEFTYMPNANFHGNDTFTFHANDGKANSNVATVNITINETDNNPPIANSFTISNVQNFTHTINWKTSSNAKDEEDDTDLSAYATTPSKGTISISGDNLTYTPNDDQSGKDSFTLNIKDSEGAITSINVVVTGIDTKKPTLVSSSPANNETDVLMDGILSFTFDERIDISSMNVSLSPSATFTSSATDKTLDISLSSSLSCDTTYTLTLNGIKDILGNIATTQSITFTTRKCIYFVSSNGTGDGSSWSKAGTLQNAISQTASKDDWQVWLKAGTYNISSVIIISKSIYLYGGFKGDERSLSQRTSANETIFDGGGSTRFIWAKSVPNGVIDGITFQNGSDVSGAFYNDKSSYTIQNCTFKNNNSTTFGAVYNRKGKMYIKNCYFYDNVGKKGAAISTTEDEKSVVEHCIFKNNTASNVGGAIYISGNSLNVLDSNFTQNQADNNGGAIYKDGGTLTIKNSNFIKNKAVRGGGLYSSNKEPKKIDIEGVNFIQNKTTGPGGAIYFYKGELVFDRLLFFNNTATYGGAVIARENTIKLTNSTFSQNIATTNNNGGIAIREGSATIANTTFVGNTVNHADHIKYGTAIGNEGSTITILNSIFWNETKDIGSDVAKGTCITNAVNSIVKNSSDITTSSNISSANPLLKPYTQNGITYYYNLEVGSPAIDAGKNDDINLTADQIGNPRIQDGTVDMGAIESR